MRTPSVRKRISVAAALAALCLLSTPSSASDGEVERVGLAAAAFHELMQSPDQGVPADLLRKCEAVAIFPRTLNLAWGLGGEYGKGVVLRHDRRSGGWSAPAFYTIGGVTLGPQIGGQSIDICLVVTDEKGLKSLLESKCTLGGDAGVARAMAPVDEALKGFDAGRAWRQIALHLGVCHHRQKRRRISRLEVAQEDLPRFEHRERHPPVGLWHRPTPGRRHRLLGGQVTLHCW